MYTHLYSRYLYPFYETVLRGRKTFALLNEFERNQHRRFSELEILQWNKFKTLIDFAYQHVPYYRRTFEHAGFHPEQLKTRDDIRRIPFLTKADIRACQDDLLAGPARGGQLFDSWTGGSTGAPISFKYDRHSYECRVAASARSDRWAGWDFGARELYVWGARPKNDPPLVRLKKHLHEHLLRRCVFNSYEFSVQNLPVFVKAFNRFRPQIIVAYAGALYTLARFAKDQGLNLYSPRAVIATAEQVYPEQKQLIEEVLKTKVFNRYGSREFMVIAMECEQRQGLHLNMDNQLTEILQDGRPVSAGETGEIVITDLNNFAMPFIRYKIGDLGVPSDQPCPCGRGLPVLHHVAGRVMEAIKTPDGRCVTGLFFTYFMHQYPEIRQFRVIQRKLEAIEIEVIPQGALSQDMLKTLKSKLAETLGSRLDIQFRIVDNIPPLPSGKQCITVSEIPTDFKNG